MLMESASLLIAHSLTSVFKHTLKEEREDQLKSDFQARPKYIVSRDHRSII